MKGREGGETERDEGGEIGVRQREMKGERGGERQREMKGEREGADRER